MSSLNQQVRRLAIPAILHSLLQTLVLVVDRAMLGHHSEASLAAMQIAGPLEWSVWSIFVAFEVGTIARVGRHVGAGKEASARRAAWVSIVFSVVMGLFVALLSPLLVSALPRAFPWASPPVVGAASDYLSITLAASPLVFIAATGIAILQASGDTRTPLGIGIFANAVHVPLNRLLILGGWGIAPLGARGCAISTAITFGLEAALALFVLSRSRVAPSPRPARPQVLVSLRARQVEGDEGRLGDEARAVAKIAMPALLERVLYHLGFLGFALIIARLGDEAMAANQALISVESICFLSADGFGIAAAALVAQKLGAERPDEARQAARTSALYAVVLLSSLGVLFFLTKSVVLPIFSRDPQVVAIGLAAVPVLACAQPFMATGIVLGQALRGAGRSREVLAVSAVSALVVRLSSTWFFALTLGWGLTGVWVGSTCDWLVRSVLFGLISRAPRSAASRA